MGADIRKDVVPEPILGKIIVPLPFFQTSGQHEELANVKCSRMPYISCPPDQLRRITKGDVIFPNFKPRAHGWESGDMK